MWLARIVGAVVALVFAAVVGDSFANREDAKGGSEPDCKGKFTPAELEMRHVRLNQPFDISVGQEVLLCDDDRHPVFLFADADVSYDLLHFSLTVDGQRFVDRSVIVDPDHRVEEVYGLMIVLLAVDYHTAKIVISRT